MDFTREPIIETVITPKEGCKIVVRSSKNVGQEEYFVDALEVVSFGPALFFRSMEKPKAFLVPAADYEILEVREARMVLKNVGLDRSIKIGGGREVKAAKEPLPEKIEQVEVEEPKSEEQAAADGRTDKKRDRRRQQRRRRGRDEPKEEPSSGEAPLPADKEPMFESVEMKEGKTSLETQEIPLSTPSFVSTLLPPPPNLISETIKSYKENILFKNAFYTKEEREIGGAEELEKTQLSEEKSQDFTNIIPPLVENEGVPSFVSFWDDMNKPTVPPVPFIETEEPEEKSPQEPPLSDKENEG